MSDSNQYKELLQREIRARETVEAELQASLLALSRCQEQLEERVCHRTRELEAELRLAQQTARFKTRLLVNISHEVRTPMNSIAGLSHLLRRSAIEEKTATQVSRLVEASDELLAIFDDVLDFSKLEVGELKIENKSFHLDRLVASVVSVLRSQAAEKGLNVEVELPAADNHWYIGDPVRIRQALLNYVSNAVRFTADGTITLSVQRQGGGEGGERLYFEVKDSGVGVEADNLQHLFEPFQHANGSGIGLAITQRLISAMGGEVGVESVLGEGSRFWFTLSLQPGSAGLQQQYHHKIEDVERELKRCCLGASILLVEDNELNSEVTEELLSRVGFDVRIAMDGAEALEQARAEQFDLVLMDVQLPVIDGLDATRLIRAMPGRETMPILALTANTSEEDKRACLDAGMNDFVAKPVSPLRIYVSLLSWLGHTKGVRL